ncbi:MAG: sugar transferase [Acidimicrobiia bacterium]
MRRCVEASVALVLLVVTAPLMLVTAMAVRLFLGRPVIFKQRRPGLHGRPFTILKFRTMLDASDRDGNPLPDEMRLTRFGQFLRSSSLDELPELVNVLRGDMSFVGPRPLMMSYLALYSPEQARRHDVRPGITGLAQVSGRNAVDWEHRFELDVYYVDHRSVGMDLKILLRTVAKVVKRDGIAAEGFATGPAFTGSGPSTGETVIQSDERMGSVA